MQRLKELPKLASAAQRGRARHMVKYDHRRVGHRGSASRGEPRDPSDKKKLVGHRPCRKTRTVTVHSALYFRTMQSRVRNGKAANKTVARCLSPV
jgi:hypothetical protein